MNFRRPSILGAGCLLGSLCLMVSAYSYQYAKFITVQDIEKITGLKGITQIQKSANADGDLNFARQDGQLILSASFLPVTAYAGAKSSQSGFKSLYPGIGEEAFIGPSGSSPSFILVFHKAAYTVMLNTELETETKARIPIEQLVAIAKIIASRM